MSQFTKERQDLINYCTTFIEDQINHVQSVIDSAKESAQNESKSSAGDKHETGKSLMQLEQENNALLLDNMLKQKPAIRCSFQKPRSNPIAGQQAPWRPSQVAGCDCHTTRNAQTVLCHPPSQVKWAILVNDMTSRLDQPPGRFRFMSTTNCDPANRLIKTA